MSQLDAAHINASCVADLVKIFYYWFGKKKNSRCKQWVISVTINAYGFADLVKILNENTNC